MRIVVAKFSLSDRPKRMFETGSPNADPCFDVSRFWTDH